MSGKVEVRKWLIKVDYLYTSNQLSVHLVCTEEKILNKQPLHELKVGRTMEERQVSRGDVFVETLNTMAIHLSLSLQLFCPSSAYKKPSNYLTILTFSE